MSVRSEQATDNLNLVVNAADAFAPGAGDFSMGIWARLVSDINAIGDWFNFGNNSSTATSGTYVGLYNNADGVTAVADTSNGAIFGSEVLTVGDLYWVVVSRTGTTLTLRVFDDSTSTTPLATDTQADANSYTGLIALRIGDFWGSEAPDAEFMHAKVHQGVEWTDAECRTESQYPFIVTAGGTHWGAWRLNDVTTGILDMTANSRDFTNSGLVTGAQEPSTLAPFEFVDPDAVISSTVIDVSGGIGQIQDDPLNPDANWFTNSGPNGTLRVSFGTPTGDPETGARLQRFYVRLRRSATGGNDPRFSAELRETGGGTALQTIATNIDVTSDTGEVFELAWDASNLATADGSAVELLLTFDSRGGGPNQRHVEVGAISWAVAYTAAGPAESVTDGINLGDSVTGTPTRSVTDGLDLGDLVSFTATYPRSVTDGLDLGDSATYGLDRSVTDGLDLGDSVLGGTARAVSDGVSVGDSVVYGLARSLTDGLSVGDSAETSEQRSVSDGLAVGDSAVYGLTRTLSDGLDLGDSVRFGTARSVSDGISLGEDIDTTFTTDSGPDGIALGDSVTYGLARSLTDGLSVGDSVSSGSVRSVTDGLSVGDLVSFTAMYPRSVSDGLSLGDSAATASAQAVTDGLSVGDVVTYGLARSASDGLSLGDSVNYGLGRDLTDGLSLGDSLAFTALYLRSVTDGVVLGDSAAASTELAIAPGNALGPDSTVRYLGPDSTTRYLGPD